MKDSVSLTYPSRQMEACHRVEDIRDLTDSAYLLRLERKGLDFEPGQYISLGLKGDREWREYSVYSGADSPCLEVLVKEVDQGYLSRKLKHQTPGQELEVDGPFGFFTLSREQRKKKLYFIATGSGISPFHCFVSSYPALNYQLIHGVRYADEDYGLDRFQPERVVRCLSRDKGGTFSGRVTHYLHKQILDRNIDRNALFFLCGNCDMIYEAFDLLKDAGVQHDHLFAEVYF